jgi:hypothetical protein
MRLDVSSVQIGAMKLKVYVFKFCKVDGADRLCGLVVRVPAYRSRGPG